MPFFNFGGCLECAKIGAVLFLNTKIHIFLVIPQLFIESNLVYREQKTTSPKNNFHSVISLAEIFFIEADLILDQHFSMIQCFISFWLLVISVVSVTYYHSRVAIFLSNPGNTGQPLFGWVPKLFRRNCQLNDKKYQSQA